MSFDFGNYAYQVYDGKAYVLIDNPDLTWRQAEQQAQQFGGHLVTINSEAENNWLADTFGDEQFWIGLNDEAQEGVFVWSSGEAVTYTQWDEGEPNNYRGNEDFAVFNWDVPWSGRGYWNDLSSSDTRWAVAEIDLKDLNAAPDAIDDGTETQHNTPLMIEVLANDTDPDGDLPQLQTFTQPTNGVVTLIDHGTPTDTTDDKVLYTPNAGFAGVDSFTYTISDGNGGSDTATVKVIVADPLSITGQVRNDLDGNGRLGDPDPGLAGATVQLFADFDGNGVEDPGGPLDTFTTGPDGQFNFTGLAAGNYIVRELNPNGFESTADSNFGGSFDRVVDVQPGANVVFLDTAASTGVITGQVRNDLNGNGRLGDPDPGLAGATVQLFADFDGNNVEDGPALQTVITGAEGQFSFSGLADGDYIIREINPNGFESTADSNFGGSFDRVIDVNPGDDVVFLDRVDAGQGSRISGQVRNDLDGDGDANDLDPGLAGATIGLFPDFNSDNIEDSAAIRVATTGTDGSFSFENLVAGDYILRELDPDGFASTADTNGGGSFNRIIDLNPGDAPVFFLDTAAAPNGQITGQVRNDGDGDGVLSDPDLGLAGATVQLFADFDGNDVEDPGGPLQTIMTGADGQFSFSGLTDGRYIVRETNPDGFTSTADSNAGGSFDRVIAVNIGDNVVFLDTVETPPNLPPEAQLDFATTVQDLPVNINVLANDTDPDGDLPLLETFTQGSNGTVTLDDNGTPTNASDDRLIYTPNADFVGGDWFTYTIGDGNGGSDTATVDVTVNPNPTPAGILPNGTYQICSHPDGAASAPTYGLRLDGLLSGNGNDIYTFNFNPGDFEGVDMRITIADDTIRIFGTAFGGLDTGNAYDPNESGLWEIDFTYNNVGTLEGDDDFIVEGASAGSNTGTITQLYGAGQSFNLEDFLGRDNSTFHLGDTADDGGFRNFEGISGWGWLSYAPEGQDPEGRSTTSDWLFTVKPEPIADSSLPNGTDGSPNPLVTPISLDLNQDGMIRTRSFQQGVTFDFLNTGEPVQGGWLAGEDGFLAIDNNGDGQINDLTELFGGANVGDGFAKLATFDSNGDTVVNAKDALFSELLVWQDANENGITDAGELTDLVSAGIASLNTAYTNVFEADAQGNIHGEVSTAGATDGSLIKTTDVYFQVIG